MKRSWFLSFFYLILLSSKSLYLQSQTFPTFLDFDGSSSFIEIPTNNNLTFSDTDKFTLEAWIKIENASSEELKKQIIKCPSGALSYTLNKVED